MENDENQESGRQNKCLPCGVTLGSKETRVLRVAMRVAVNDCEKQALRNMIMVIVSIVSCIGALLLGDKLDSLFMSSTERHALKRIEEAKFKLIEKFASLDDRAIQDIDVVYSKFRNEFGLNLIAPHGGGTASAPDNGLVTREEAVDKVKPSEPPMNLDSDAPPQYTDVKEVTLPIQKYDDLRRLIESLKTDRAGLLEKTANLEKMTDAGLRNQAALYKERIALIDADLLSLNKKLENADSKAESLWKAREGLNQQIGTLNEKLSKAAVMAEVRSMFSTAFIRGGALILLVWLVKIFIRRYQHAVNGKEFYTAALNALQISGVRSLTDFKEALSILRRDEFELRDADLELFSDKISGKIISMIKPGSKV